MKKIIVLALFGVLFGTACQKSTIETIDEPIVENPTDIQVAQGNFMNGSYTTSGKVSVVKTSDNQRLMLFENLKTDAGPDLRIYLSEEREPVNFIEVGNEVKNGNYQLSIPASADLTKQKFVLIWCKQFSVLFGSAELI